LNGSTIDKFAVLVAKTKKGYVAFVDLAAKGDFTGAKAIRNYGEKQQFFTMTLEDPKTMTPPLTFALHINDDATQIVLHFDDGGHGTHVAGIASGFGLMGRKGFNGIAPGAQVLSLKIGDNTLSGGSTTSDSMRKAIEFAGEWSKKHKRAVIINMSYGIGSEIEGESDIDLALDDLLQKYPMLSACVSAGNSGPGLSTIGTPAAARLAVTAAAMLPKAASEAMFGSPTDRDKVFSFSSRGGELSKPDLLAPGIASASVPRFDHRDIKGGTSMAAPQLAGAHALLVSAALATKTRFTGRTLKRALIDSASPISGYLPIAQGAGVPNISNAFKALKALSTHKEPFAVAGYAVRAAVPTSDSGFGHAAYWRVGNWLPAPEDGQSFSISAMFHDVSAKEREGFQTMLRFKSDSAWLKVDRRFGRLLGEKKLKIRVKYNRKALVKPGVYHGGIQVYPDDGAGIAAASLWNTIVVPYTFNEDNHYRLTRKNMRLDPGDFERIPILVPPGATHCRIALSVPRGNGEVTS
jgi:subtilisin family serine protease